jgi:ABC-type proline/glycine betaine transport system substrate-binding protein
VTAASGFGVSTATAEVDEPSDVVTVASQMWSPEVASTTVTTRGFDSSPEHVPLDEHDVVADIKTTSTAALCFEPSVRPRLTHLK